MFARASTKEDESAFYCSVCSGWFVANECRPASSGYPVSRARGIALRPRRLPVGAARSEGRTERLARRPRTDEGFLESAEEEAEERKQAVPTPREIYAGLNEHVGAGAAVSGCFVTGPSPRV